MGRERAAAELRASEGGPLGIIRVRGILIGVSSLDEAARTWGPLSEADAPVARGVVRFGAGPDIHLVTSKTQQIQRIEVVVHSLSQTADFLGKRHLRSENRPGMVTVVRKSIDGLSLSFVQE